jgi:hypothetical protein
VDTFCLRSGRWPATGQRARSFWRSGTGRFGAHRPATKWRIACHENGPASRYEFTGLPPGRYTITVSAFGFAPSIKKVTVIAGRPRRVDIHLVIAAQTQKLQVNVAAPRIDIAPQNNASAVVITGRSLDALSNDPDELQRQLLALAGPSVGPGGSQIYINGFT